MWEQYCIFFLLAEDKFSMSWKKGSDNMLPSCFIQLQCERSFLALPGVKVSVSSPIQWN